MIHANCAPTNVLDAMALVDPVSGSRSEPPSSFTMEELGFAAWPNNDRGMLSPANVPPWLQEQVRLRDPFPSPPKTYTDDCVLFLSRLQNLGDLGIPENGFDGIFLEVSGVNGWVGIGEIAHMPEAW